MAKKVDSFEITNKKAYHDYFVDETVECGISLRGNEVKSIRSSMCSIKEAWCRVQNGELVIRGMHITKWSTANLFDIDEDRERVLLAHKKEIRALDEKAKETGVSLIPLKIYFSNGKCKVLVGVCRGKKLYDKREALKEAQAKRDINRAFKEMQR